MSILHTKRVEKHFQEGREVVPVLRGIDFAVERGEIVSLEGPSGSGKTTFLSIMGCILTPSSGEVVIEGQTVGEKSLADIRKRSLGFVFQQFNLFPSLTAIENVEYALNVKGLRNKNARTEAQRVIEAVGLGDRQHFLPRELSGGQKQRVAIARALAGSAPIVLAD
jgi:putative ABC transport system ATP-binding protein